MNQESFTDQVRDALARFHDRAYLQAHPLARQILGGILDGQEGARLQRLLLEALEDLKPQAGAQPALPERRRYDYLYLHYIEGLPHTQVAQRLNISYRQGHRDHHEAIQALSQLLWRRIRGSELLLSSKAAGGGGSETERATAELLEAELARLGRASERTLTDLRAVVDAALATVAGLAAERQLRIRAVLAPDLPSVTPIADVVRQALLSVLSYALETAAGEAVEIWGTADQRDVCLSILWAMDAPSVSLPSMHSDTRLDISRRLLDTQGGSLELTRPSEAEPLLEARMRLPAVGPVTVLVIDDDPDFLQLLQRYLRGQPYRMLAATNAPRALELAAAESPQVVVLDVLMPTQDGWMVLQELRRLEQTRNVPIVICSVLSDRNLARSLGATLFLVKPVTQRALLSVLEECQGR